MSTNLNICTHGYIPPSNQRMQACESHTSTLCSSLLLCNPREVGPLGLGQSAARFKALDAIVPPSVSGAAGIGDSAAASAASLCGVFLPSMMSTSSFVRALGTRSVCAVSNRGSVNVQPWQGRLLRCSEVLTVQLPDKLLHNMYVASEQDHVSVTLSCCPRNSHECSQLSESGVVAIPVRRGSQRRQFLLHLVCRTRILPLVEGGSGVFGSLQEPSVETTTGARHLRTSLVACGLQVGELTKIVTFREFSYLTPTRILLAGCRNPSSLPALALSRRDPGLEPVLDWQARVATRFAAVAGPHRKATTLVIIARLASPLVTSAGPLCCLGNQLGAFCMHCLERAVNHKRFRSHSQ